MSRLGITEIVVLAVLIIVFFGSKKLPEFIRSVGLAIKEFKKAMSDQ